MIGSFHELQCCDCQVHSSIFDKKFLNRNSEEELWCGLAFCGSGSRVPGADSASAEQGASSGAGCGCAEEAAAQQRLPCNEEKCIRMMSANCGQVMRERASRERTDREVSRSRLNTTDPRCALRRPASRPTDLPTQHLVAVALTIVHSQQ